MAQIPVPNFGQAVAAPAQAVQIGHTDVSSGLEVIGEEAMKWGIRQKLQQDDAKASLALATATNEAHDATGDVTRGMWRGEISPDDADVQLRQRLDDITQQQTRDLSPVHQASVRAALVATTGGLTRQLGDTVVKYNQSSTLATLDATGQQLQVDAARRGPANVADTYDAILDMTGSSAGLTPAQVAERKSAFRQSTTAGYYTLKGTTLHAAGNLPGVTDTLHEVLGPAGDQMTPMQKDHVVTHLVGLQNNLLAAEERARRAAEGDETARQNDAVDSFNQARSVVFNGQYLSPDAIADLTSRTTGTRMAMPARQLLTMQEQAVSFASMPADQRASMLERYRAEAANPAVGTSPDGAKQVSLMESLDGKIKQAQDDNPWKAAQTYGLLVNAPALPMTPDAIGPTLDVRMQKIAKVEAWVGHKISPLQPQEAGQIVEMLKALPPPAASELLSTLGGMVQDPDRIGAIAKQLGDKDNTMAESMAFAGDRTEKGKLVAEYVMRGSKALRDRTAAVDKTAQSGWLATITNAISGAYSSQEAENMAIDAAYKITAARDASGEASGDTDTAIKWATGGIVKHGAAGAKIPLPIGLDEKAFNQRLAAITPSMLQPQAPDGNVYAGGAVLPLMQFVKQLPDATLVHAGQGLYCVRAGDTFVTNGVGRRIVLKVSQ